MFDLAGERFGVVPVISGEDGVGRRTQFPTVAGGIEEIAADRLHLRDELIVRKSGLEVDRNGRLRHGAEGGTQLIDRTAFQAVAGEHQLADGRVVAGADVDVFQRLALGLGEDGGRPRVLPAAVGGRERMLGDAEVFENARPAAVRTGF